MPNTMAIPPPAKDFEAAKRQYLELYASKAVTNTYLTIAVLCLAVVSLASIAVNVRLHQKSRSPERIVVWIDDLGRPQVTRSAGAIAVGSYATGSGH